MAAKKRRSGWLRAAAALTADEIGRAEVPCPNCGYAALEYLYVVVPETRKGVLDVWCRACMHGVYFTTVTAPPGLPTVPMGSAGSAAARVNFIRVDPVTGQVYGRRWGHGEAGADGV